MRPQLKLLPSPKHVCILCGSKFMEEAVLDAHLLNIHQTTRARLRTVAATVTGRQV